MDKFLEYFNHKMSWFYLQSKAKATEGHEKYPIHMWEYDVKQLRQHTHEEILDLVQFWSALYFKIDELTDENEILKEEVRSLKLELNQES